MCRDNPGLSTKQLAREALVRFCEGFSESYAHFLYHHKAAVILQLQPGESEEEMITRPREAETAEFRAFLAALGAPVDMREHTGYDGETGKLACECLLARPDGHELLMHVASWLPAEGDSEKTYLERKRHVGNDTVAVLFRQAGGALGPAEAAGLMASRVLRTWVSVTPEGDGYRCSVVTRTAQKQVALPSVLAADVGGLAGVLALLCLAAYRLDPTLASKLARQRRALLIAAAE